MSSQIKKYIFDFTLADGTTRSIPIGIPTGEDGGYYVPKIEMISDNEVRFSFEPSKTGMPAVEPVTVNIQGVDLNGYATKQDIEDYAQPKGDYLGRAELPVAIDTALEQADESGAFDGVSPTVAISNITGGHRIAITDRSGTKTVDVMDGGNGDPGRGIANVKRTAGTGAGGTTDTYTIYYTDNTTSTFTVYNGADGAQGPAYTLTDIDKASITQAVIDALPVYNGEVTDA